MFSRLLNVILEVTIMKKFILQQRLTEKGVLI